MCPFSRSRGFFSGIAHRAGPSPHVKPVEVGRHLDRRAERPGNRPLPRHSSRGNLCETEEELKDDTLPALEFVYQEAQRYLLTIETQPVKLPDADSAARSLPTDLPENGLERLTRSERLPPMECRRDALVWPTVLSLRHRRNNARRPRRRLAHVDPRSELVQLGLLSLGHPSRGDQRQLAARSIDLPKSWGGILTTRTPPPTSPPSPPPAPGGPGAMESTSTPTDGMVCRPFPLLTVGHDTAPPSKR